MAFDQASRNRLQKFVADARTLLSTEFTRQLQSVYGIDPESGTEAKLDSLKGLGEEERETAGILRQMAKHYRAGSPSGEPGVAIERIIREQAFTILNRLCALRMAEARGIVVECVGKGSLSTGFQMYVKLAGSALGEQMDAYRLYIFGIFDELSVDLAVLFDRHSPMGRLFPRNETLEKLLALVNAPELSGFWIEDETIGWIYQYFNSKDERKKMRDESAAPRNSRELAVRNQFFTPRYVVEFLTDNTLGRIWYEMRQGNTAFKEKCRYLIRRPNEIFLAGDEKAPSNQSETTDLSQEELLKQPLYIEYRPKKDPRDLRVLDPACGSGHFLLYAFDLLERIYEEAWADSQSPKSEATNRSLLEDYTTLEVLKRNLPKLIIEYNLHGIDIDPRCAQIAGLSLWLRAQKAWKDRGLKSVQRPAITRSNIVCAEPMPGEKELLREFVDREFKSEERGIFLRLLEGIWEEMQLAGEAGSLLKIKEEISEAIEEAKAAWKKLQSQPSELFSTTDLNALRTQSEIDFSVDLINLHADFFEGFEERVYSALRNYAEQAENGDGFKRRLFVGDTVRGFAFIDVSRKLYEVVLMNPPFGSFSKPWSAKSKSVYPNSYNDILAAFVERFLCCLHHGGRLGAITSRTCFFLSSFKDWRLKVVLGQSAIRAIADLGQGIMDDAMVEAAAYVLENNLPASMTPVFRAIADPDRQRVLESCLEAHLMAHTDVRIFLTNPTAFQQLPDSPFVYWIKASLLRKLNGRSSFKEAVGDVRQGLATADNPRFVRALWEVSATSRAAEGGREWVPYILAGPSQPWFSPVTLIVNWAKDAAELWNNLNSKGNVRSNIWMLRDSIKMHFFRPGFSWTRRAVRFIPYVIPRGCIPSASRYMAFPKNGMESMSIGVSASRIVSAFLRFYGEKFEFPNFLVGTLKILPWPRLSEDTAQTFEELVNREVEQRRLAYQNHEPFFEFLLPCKVRDFSHAGKALAFSMESLIGESTEKLVAASFGFDEQEALSIERDLLEAIKYRDWGATLVPDRSDASQKSEAEEGDDDSDFVLDFSPGATEESHISYLVGVAFARWDLRYATGEKSTPDLPDPFAPLPVCPPGQLQNAQGLPVRPADVPADYPIQDIPWDGILVDDPGHLNDIEARIRQVLEIIWKDRADAIAHEACQILDVKSLREYFRKPSLFFADHLKRYSKSRRYAPIYWPLSTASGSYTLWIYYHRLDDQTLYACVNNFVQPKLDELERQIQAFKADKKTKELADVLDFQGELEELKRELLSWAPRWKPNLNDGVIITAAPLYMLFRLPKWRKDLEACWKALERGDYDWAHLAYTLWPERAREKCRTDKSLAIAHDLEALYIEPAGTVTKKKRAKKVVVPELGDDLE